METKICKSIIMKNILPHLQFALRYPQTVVQLQQIYEDTNTKLLQQWIKDGLIPIISYISIRQAVEFYKLFPNDFPQFKNIVNDWNKMMEGDFI